MIRGNAISENRKLALIIIGIFYFLICMSSIIMERKGFFEPQYVHKYNRTPQVIYIPYSIN